jgi:pimeloyl-ACP methyl ester carboxylesterase
MIYYQQQLQPKDDLKRLSTIVSARTSRIDGLKPLTSASETPSPKDGSRSSNVTLLLSGYSYGSLILSRLPPVAEMLGRFEAAPRGTTAAEIILRAFRLAKESRSTLEIKQTLPQSRGRRLTPADATKPRLHASPVIVGGEETPPQERRRSRESSRGNIVHRSAEVPLRIKARMRRRSSGVRPGTGHGPIGSEESVTTGTKTPLPGVRVMYLLISPVLPPIAHTLVPPVSWTGLRGAVDKSTGVGAMTWPTLAVWGSMDSFTSNRRLKAWAERLSKAGPATLKWVDVEGAGHFWREQGVMRSMTEEIGHWVREHS